MGAKLMTNPETKKGVAIKSVTKDGVADLSGLTAGTVITHINGTDVTEFTDMKPIAALMKPNEMNVMRKAAGNVRGSAAANPTYVDQDAGGAAPASEADGISVELDLSKGKMGAKLMTDPESSTGVAIKSVTADEPVPPCAATFD